MGQKRLVQTPRQLQIGDHVYMIVEGTLDEHLGIKSDSKLKYYAIDSIRVTDLGEDADDSKKIVINKKTSLPADGKFKYDGDIILNEEEALEIINEKLEREEKKAEAIVEKAQKELKAVRDNHAIYAEKTSVNKKSPTVIVNVREDNSEE